jgi:ribosomal protein S18 acetylase RimI-like enzyme
MTHPLDRPAWSALNSGQSHLAVGDARAKRYAEGYAVFLASADDSAESLNAMAALNPPDGGMILMEARPAPLAPTMTAASIRDGVQMICSALRPGPADLAFESLSEADAPEMLALATLTKPGPFFDRTHRLGDFIGVKRDGRLIAMAGERMKPAGFTEVSGVCTHPDFRGQGLAGAMMRIVTERILARGEQAFLHAYAENTGAIGLYERLGFSIRTPVTVIVTGPKID